MSVRFLAVAKEEMQHAYRYYKSVSPHIAIGFRDEVRAAIKRIEAHPEAWQPLDAQFRRCQLVRFPYGLIYQPHRGDFIVVAVAHLHREPDYWRPSP